MSKNSDLRERYLALKTGRHWQSWPLIRQVRALRFRRLTPMGAGRSSGLSTIRYYWADFLEQHRADIRGHALEIGETTTIRAFGGDAITQAHAIDLTAHSPEVKIVADLSRADHAPMEQYDCFVNQFTTTVIYDIDAFLFHSIRLLKPGGVLLINFWCVDFYLHRGLDMGTGAPLYMYHWFTPIQVENLLRRVGLTVKDFTVQIYGNLLTRMAFLLNEPAQAFTPAELNYVDPGQPLLICVRVVRPTDWQVTPPVYRDPLWTPTVKSAQMRTDTGHYGDEYEE
jgi:hypothetical protein